MALVTHPWVDSCRSQEAEERPKAQVGQPQGRLTSSIMAGEHFGPGPSRVGRPLVSGLGSAAP